MTDVITFIFCMFSIQVLCKTCMYTISTLYQIIFKCTYIVKATEYKVGPFDVISALKMFFCDHDLIFCVLTMFLLFWRLQNLITILQHPR